jgi:hypothetical protein
MSSAISPHSDWSLFSEKLRGIAVGRHNWTFAGSDEGGRRTAAIYTLIETARLNDIDPQAWLTDLLSGKIFGNF